MQFPSQQWSLAITWKITHVKIQILLLIGAEANRFRQGLTNTILIKRFDNVWLKTGKTKFFCVISYNSRDDFIQCLSAISQSSPVSRNLSTIITINACGAYWDA